MGGGDRDPNEAQDRIRVHDRRRVRPHVEPGPPASEPESIGGAGDALPGDAGGVPSSAAPASGDELAAARRQAAEYFEQMQRMTADFDNARKRMVKDQTRAVELAAERLISQLLDILDEFRIAMIHAEEAPKEFAPYLKGFELVYAKLFDTLRADGLERMEAVGAPFDPTLHEALLQTGEGDGHPVVAEVFRDGYTFKGKVLRPAGVRVHVGEE
jgi:molecular chaperone GrpE